MLALLKKWFGGKIPAMAADPEKVEAVLKILNAIPGPGKGEWTEAAGYHGLVALTIKDGKYTPIENSIMAVKTFVNTKTGEVKTYWAALFDAQIK